MEWGLAPRRVGSGPTQVAQTRAFSSSLVRIPNRNVLAARISSYQYGGS